MAQRVEAEAKQSSILDSFHFCLERKGDQCLKPVTANDLDDILNESTDLATRLAAREASKETARLWKPGLVASCAGCANAVAKEMGYRSFFDLQVADYDMSVDEMMEMLSGPCATWPRSTGSPLLDQVQ